MKRLLLAAAVTVLVAGACSASPNQLAGHEFLSVNVTEGGAPKRLVDGTQIRLTFDDGNLSANAGCNHVGGTFRVEAGRLLFEGGEMTAMGCDQARHDQDDWLVALLASRPAIRLVGSDLTIDGAGGTSITLRDREVLVPDANLVGPTWTVESIIAGDTVSSAPGNIRATVLFRADGTLEVFAGCNRGGGTWSAIGAGIQVGAIGLTKMACDGPAGQLESSVLEVLEAGAISVSIDANALTLQAAGHGLQLRAG